MMQALWFQLTAWVAAILMVGVSAFQVLLFFGIPLASYSWGGRYEGALPKGMRWLSLLSAVVLLLFAFVILGHIHVFSVGQEFPTTTFVWGIALFMGLNTLGNLASKSKKEKLVMTPLSAVIGVCCFILVVFG